MVPNTNADFSQRVPLFWVLVPAIPNLLTKANANPAAAAPAKVAA